MDKFSAKNDDKLLTLAFEKAATCETRVFHPWRYFIAEGETLQQINTIISEYATVAQGYIDLAQKAGAKSYNGSYFSFDFQPDEMEELTGKERTDGNFTGGRGSEPWQCKRVARLPGFVVTDSRAYGQFLPDVATPLGAALRDDARALKERAQPALRFARWLGAAGVEVPENGNYPFGTQVHASATATQIGDQWIVAVPVRVVPNTRIDHTSVTEEWTHPPGSAPLGVSEYFGLLEKNSLIKNTPKTPQP